MTGKGTKLSCGGCGKTWEMTETGTLQVEDGKNIFSHIPDWYAWEREQVRKEIEAGTYILDIPVRIGMLADSKSIYFVGDGRLVHNAEGFRLTGCGGKLDYQQSPAASYSLYSDYYWYKIGDMICIGDASAFYYCFPKKGGDIAVKPGSLPKNCIKSTDRNFKLRRTGKIDILLRSRCTGIIL